MLKLLREICRHFSRHHHHHWVRSLAAVQTVLHVWRSVLSKAKQMIYIAVLSNCEITAEPLLQYSPCSLDPCMAATYRCIGMKALARYQIILLGKQRHIGVNNLTKVVAWQWCISRELNPWPFERKSNALTSNHYTTKPPISQYIAQSVSVLAMERAAEAGMTVGSRATWPKRPRRLCWTASLIFLRHKTKLYKKYFRLWPI